MTLTRAILGRLGRNRRGLLAAGAWAGLALASALRLRGAATGADDALRRFFPLVVLPLLVYAIVSATFGGRGLRPSLRGYVALGAAPARAGLVALAVATAVSALASAVVAVAVCVIAHGPGDAPLVADVPLTFVSAFLGGAAYAAYFSAGSAFGSGALRGFFLAADWVIGSAAGFGALFTPRGHVASLFGGIRCFDLSRRASSVMLLVLTVGFFLLGSRLARRAT